MFVFAKNYFLFELIKNYKLKYKSFVIFTRWKAIGEIGDFFAVAQTYLNQSQTKQGL